MKRRLSETHTMQLHAFKDADAVSLAAAEWITDLIQQKLRNQSRFTWLLSGGNTPKHLYQLLAAQQFSSKIDWKKIHIFFGDERVVPFEDERNNGKMAHETLLSKVPIPQEQVHFIRTDVDPTIAAEEYEILLRQYFDEARTTFDLALLGMGDDGHTLSIFPGSSLVDEKKRWVVALFLPSQQMHRITLTPLVVNRSATIAFLVTGLSKSRALEQVIKGDYQPEVYPAQLIKPANGELHWFVDESAFSASGS